MGLCMTLPATVERFTQVDTVDPKFFVRFVDAANEMASVRACKRRMEALLQPRVGQRILDLGCGTGDDARALARLVAPGGRVVGVDNSEAMLAEARRRAVGLSLSLEYRLSDAQRLDLPDETFDGCRTERTFMHLEAPEQALAEMVRVARPGGKVVVFDFDWDTLLVDHPDPSLTRRILDLMADSLRNGRIGRRLPGMFEEAGLGEISIAPHTVLMRWAFFPAAVRRHPEPCPGAGPAVGAGSRELAGALGGGRADRAVLCCADGLHRRRTEAVAEARRHSARAAHPYPRRACQVGCSRVARFRRPG
jgi:ubiquinone/menaquinone biosynthesis C-methylase UbiE